MHSRCAVVLGFIASLLLISSTEAGDPGSDRRTIVVRTVDVSGHPIGGVNVLRSVWTDQKDFKRTDEFVTDADGIASVSLPKTMTILRLWARKKGLPTLQDLSANPWHVDSQQMTDC